MSVTIEFCHECHTLKKLTCVEDVGWICRECITKLSKLPTMGTLVRDTSRRLRYRAQRA